MIIGILFSIITIISSINLQILSGEIGMNTFLYELFVEGIGIALIILIFSFFPGKFYYNIAKNEKEANKLTKISLILLIISVIISLVFSSFNIVSPLVIFGLQLGIG